MASSRWHGGCRRGDAGALGTVVPVGQRAPFISVREWSYIRGGASTARIVFRDPVVAMSATLQLGGRSPAPIDRILKGMVNRGGSVRCRRDIEMRGFWPLG